MKNRKTTILLLAALLTGAVVAQTPQQTSTTRSSTNLQATLINTDPVPLQSGEDGDLTFKIRNTGEVQAKDVNIELLDNYPFSVKPDRKTEYSLGNIMPGQEYQISTEVLVSEDAPDGPNNFKVRISTGDFSRTVNVPVEVQSRDIELNVANLRTRPGQLMPDTDNNVMMVDIVNNGEKTAENTVLELDLPGFFQKTSSFSTRQALGNLQPGQAKTAEFNFDINESAPAGDVTVTGDLIYSAGDSSSRITDEVSFELNMEGRPQFRITDVQSNLKTGKTSELRLKVKNIGEEKSSSTRIRVLDSSDQPFSYDSSSKYIGTLEPGQTGEAVFNVETDSGAPAKKYLIDFETRGVKNTEVFVEDETIQASVENGKSSEESSVPLPVIAGLFILLALAGIYRYRDRFTAGSKQKEEEKEE